MPDGGPVQGREGMEAPSDAFRRNCLLLGILGLDLSCLLWKFGAGGFALLPPPKPATILGTSQEVAPFVVGLVAIVVLMYRRQTDATAGRASGWLFRAAMYVSIVVAMLGGAWVALNLAWIASMI